VCWRTTQNQMIFDFNKSNRRKSLKIAPFKLTIEHFYKNHSLLLAETLISQVLPGTKDNFYKDVHDLHFPANSDRSFSGGRTRSTPRASNKDPQSHRNNWKAQSASAIAGFRPNENKQKFIFKQTTSRLLSFP